MNALLLNITDYLQSTYGIDPYTATDEQLLEAGYHNQHNRNPQYLPRTTRAKSTLNRRWKNSLWKKAQFFASCNPSELYTLLIELKTPRLHSGETAALAAALARQLPGEWFYWVEQGKSHGVHMHVVLHSGNLPKSRIQHGSRYFNLNPWKLRYQKYETSLEAIVRTVTYGAKIKQGGYRGDGESWKRTWVAEVREALDCERVKVKLSDSNIPTRGIREPTPALEAMWKQVTEDRHRKRMQRLGYEVSV